MKKKLVLFWGLTLGSVSAHADIFTNGSVDAIALYPTQTSVYYDAGTRAIVQPGPTFTTFEFNGPNDASDNLTVAFNNNQILITVTVSQPYGSEGAPFNGEDFKFSNMPAIFSASLDNATSSSEKNIIVTSDSTDVFWNWNGVNINPGDQIIIDVNPVPSPSALWLIVTTLFGYLGFTRRKQ